MLRGYIPIFIFLLVAIAFPIVALGLGKLLRPSAPTVTKLEAYECGIKAVSNARGRYTVETIFLFPWAVRYKAFGWFGVVEVAVFLAILFVGYFWALKKGALQWV
jgi:NADH-quinone oxidoreductase subunit A